MFIRTRSLSAIALAALIAFPSLASAATLQPLERWRSYAGVSWDTRRMGKRRRAFPARLTRPLPVSILMQRAGPLSVRPGWFLPPPPPR